MSSLTVTLVNVIRTEKRVALLAVRPDGTNKAFTVDSRVAERALQELHTNGRPAMVELTIQVVGDVVVSWDAENGG